MISKAPFSLSLSLSLENPKAKLFLHQVYPSVFADLWEVIA
jgi:hypothetical protein